jgi:hypothetical protein
MHTQEALLTTGGEPFIEAVVFSVPLSLEDREKVML